MKIVNRVEFLKMGKVLYQKYEPCWLDEPMIKHDTLPHDFGCASLFGDFENKDSGDHADIFTQMENGVEIPVDPEMVGRDGCFDMDQLFLIYNKEDIQTIIKTLKDLIDE